MTKPKMTKSKLIPLAAPKTLEIDTKELGFSLMPSEECLKEIREIETFIRTSPHRARNIYFD